MLLRCTGCVVVALAVTSVAAVPARAQTVVVSENFIQKYNPFKPFDPSQPLTVPELSKWVDRLGEEMRDDGLIVLKQPDVFSQARMTRFRTDFEGQMSTDLANFHLVLAARINRLDSATTTSTTALSAALAAPGTTNAPTAITQPPTLPTAPATFGGGATLNGTGLIDATKTSFGTLGPATNNFAPITSTSATNATALGLGVDPTVYLDEKKRFLEHLNQIRRINLGPDQNDSSGYGLYLIRMPVSITPGEKTYHGFGADLAVTVEHEFPPHFLPATFQNLVINDIVDELGPFIYEVIRSDLITTLQQLQDARVSKRILTIQNNLLMDQSYLLGFVGKMAEAIVLPADAAGVQPLEGVVGHSATPEQLKRLVDQYAAPLTSFIIRESKLLTGDPAKDKTARNAIADRLAILLAAREKFAGVTLASKADFLQKVGAVREGEGVDADLKESVLVIVRSIIWQSLRNAADSQTGKLSKPLDAAAQIQLLNVLAPLIKSLYATALSDDVGTLDTLVGVSKDDQTKTTNPLAVANEAMNNKFFTYDLMINLNLASTRTAKQLYPIAPRELSRFFLEENILSLAKDAQQAYRTTQPRANEIRSYLRLTLTTAYEAMSHVNARPGQSPWEPAPLTDPTFMDKILEAVKERQFKNRPDEESELKTLDDTLIKRVEQTRDNVNGRPIAALCWAIAVDAVLLDEALRRDARKVFETHGMPTDMIAGIRFYIPHGHSNDMAQAVFKDYVKTRWPVITFSLDPVTDQQNIADSFNLKRDLQLAVSFAFATGQIGFNQLNTFRRQIEQSSDTVALNRTVVGFTHSNDIFGFRFSPRFQNPPNQRTNFGVIASQLISGGPGPDYQIKKSKLEAGMRELTAIILIPTFLPTLRMNVTGNWFRLNDPEHLVFHTKRMMERGRRVQELRQAAVDTCNANLYRGADLRNLNAKLEQLEAMLPMQSKVIQLPFENTANGFDLLSDGATALVPELSGYTGIDVIQGAPLVTQAVVPQAGSPPAVVASSSSGITMSSTTTTASSTTQTVASIGGTGSIADVFITGKYISILDTKVIAGGRSAAFEVLSREVIHVQIPSNAMPMTTKNNPQKYIEVYLATPNGISNSVLIPYADPTPPGGAPQAQAPASAAVKPAYDLATNSQSMDVFYQWLNGPDNKPALVATAEPASKSIGIKWDDPAGIAPKLLQVQFSGAIGTQAINFAMTADSGNSGDYSVDSRLLVATLLRRLQDVVVAPPTLPPASLPLNVSVQPWLPADAAGFRVRSEPKALATPLTVNLQYSSTGANALQGVVVPDPAAPPRVPPPPPPAPAVIPVGFKTSQMAPDEGKATGSGARDDTSVVRAAQQTSSPSVPLPLPSSLSVPLPPPSLGVPGLQPPNAATREADQVTRLLTGQPLAPDVPVPPAATALAAMAAPVPAATNAPAAAAAAVAASPPIVVTPSPVVVISPPPVKAKRKLPKSRFHPSRIFSGLMQSRMN